jgi:hypothetical protein
MPEYLPAEIQVKIQHGATFSTAPLPTFSKDTDNFALAILIFQLLMNGVHPFACAVLPCEKSVSTPQPIDNIIKGKSPFLHKMPGIRIPAFAPKITVLPDEIQKLFRCSFIDGHSTPSSRPKPTEWQKALRNLHNELEVCGNVISHKYYRRLSKCPWCDIEKNKFAQDIQNKIRIGNEDYVIRSISPSGNRCIISPIQHYECFYYFNAAPFVNESFNIFNFIDMIKSLEYDFDLIIDEDYSITNIWWVANEDIVIFDTFLKLDGIYRLILYNLSKHNIKYYTNYNSRPKIERVDKSISIPDTVRTADW